MKTVGDLREASPRAQEGGVALTSPSRGRSTAPHLSLWFPIAAKVAAAAAGIVVLAIIGAKAGAHGPPATVEPAPSATPAVLAAAFLPSMPSLPGEADGGAIPAPAESAEPAPAAEPSAAAGAGLLADGRVVLNTASETELTKLPGVGPSRARAILALRQRLTRFRAVEDLLRIKGIGRKMLRRLRPSVVLDPPAAGTSSGPAPPGKPPLGSTPPSEDSGGAGE